MRQWGVNNLPKVAAQQRHGRASNPRPLDRKSDPLPLSHPATPSHRAKDDNNDEMAITGVVYGFIWQSLMQRAITQRNDIEQPGVSHESYDDRFVEHIPQCFANYYNK